MARAGLWKVRSGAFAGWRDGDLLYDARGCHHGHFEANVAYTTQGEYAGEIYRDDWIGKREGTEPARGNVECALDSLTIAPLPDRTGLPAEGWSDPDF